MKEDMEDEIVRRVGEKRVERAESGAMRSRKKTSVVLWIIFWAVVIGGAIALNELFRK